jgi:hypothetical protein
MSKKIDLCAEPSAFFQERLTSVLSRKKVETLQVTEYYLVDLLARYMFASNLFDKAGSENDHDPLAIMFLRAQSKELPVNEKVKLLRKLGDTSLYVSGFFGDSLNRKVIDLDYYRQMGTIAYRSLSETVRDDSFQVLYHELYEKFLSFVEVLNEFSQEVLVQGTRDILRLYEIYLQTGSEAAKRQIEEKGLPIPPRVPHNGSERKN